MVVPPDVPARLRVPVCRPVGRLVGWCVRQPTWSLNWIIACSAIVARRPAIVVGAAASRPARLWSSQSAWSPMAESPPTSRAADRLSKWAERPTPARQQSAAPDN